MTGFHSIGAASLADLMGRAAEAAAGSTVDGVGSGSGGVEESDSAAGAGDAFGKALSGALDSLNESQLAGDVAARDVAAGRTEDLAGSLLKIEEAEITLQLATTVRNKAIEAYQEIMRMQI